MAKLPLDVQQALQRQAPKELRRNFEKEIKDKLIENQFEIEEDYDQDNKMVNEDSDEMKD